MSVCLVGLPPCWRMTRDLALLLGVWANTGEALDTCGLHTGTFYRVVRQACAISCGSSRCVHALIHQPPLGRLPTPGGQSYGKCRASVMYRYESIRLSLVASRNYFTIWKGNNYCHFWPCHPWSYPEVRPPLCVYERERRARVQIRAHEGNQQSGKEREKYLWRLLYVKIWRSRIEKKKDKKIKKCKKQNYDTVLGLLIVTVKEILRNIPQNLAFLLPRLSTVNTLSPFFFWHRVRLLRFLLSTNLTPAQPYPQISLFFPYFPSAPPRCSRNDHVTTTSNERHGYKRKEDEWEEGEWRSLHF